MSNRERLYRPCAGICLKNKDGLVFAGKRFGNFDHAWMMPQGGIDKGEDHLAAARRELHEETGVTSAKLIVQSTTWRRYDLPTDIDVEFWKGKYVGQEQLWFLFEFEGEDSEINIGGLGGEKAEFSDWTWKPITEIVSQIVPFKRDVYKGVLEEFAPYLA